MNTNARIAAASIPTAVAPVGSAPASGGFQDSQARQDAERTARYRLVIEEGPTHGSFIYKTLDSLTGEVIRQLPREEVVRLAGADGYDTGALIDTSA